MTIIHSFDGDAPRSARAEALVQALDGRSVVLVGMMGAGKTSVGRRLAQKLALPFADADIELETAARMTIPEIFARHGEPFFRDRERRVIDRLLSEGQKVLATGGGAFMLPATRERIKESAVSVWLKADFDVLARRVRRRTNRPKLATDDPDETLRRLIDERYPIYALADHTVISHEGAHEAVVEGVLAALEKAFGTASAATRADDGSGIERLATVPVELEARSYEILIGDGLLKQAGAHIRRLAPKAACLVVSDENVAALHLPTLRASLEASEIRTSEFILAPGESTKSFAWYERLCEAAIGAHMERGDCIVALGGGVVGDLAGFVAATVRRGMRFIQIPTTLLAQVDSSVGGKTAINAAHGKNLIGAFHQPALVLADVGVLESLPIREFRAGYAEVMKYGLIDDAPFFEWLEQNWAAVFGRRSELSQAITTSCKSKAKIVGRDETEQGDRMLLNLGHTFGHALEHLAEFDSERLNHGEAVGIGLSCAFRFAARLGHCSSQDALRVDAHLRAVGLPSRLRDAPIDGANSAAILDAMYQDKKVSGGALTFILARGIGQSFVARGVPVHQVIDFLEDELSDG